MVKKTKKATSAKRKKRPVKKLTIADLQRTTGGHVDSQAKADIEAFGGRTGTVEY